MATLHFAQREIEAKVVFYGPALSGKTTNLRALHRLVPSGQRGELHELATDQDRTLFFDFLPVELGEIGGYAARFKLFSVPGQAYYRDTRRVVLQGADAVVFVADSSPDRLQANLDALADLVENLRILDPAGDLPVVLQLNKRDVEGALPVETLLAELNGRGWPMVEAVASEGRGVLATIHEVTALASARLAARLAGGGELPRADGPRAEIDEVDHVLEKVLEVRPAENREAERRRQLEQARPDDVDGFLLEFVERGDDASLGLEDPPSEEHQPEPGDALFDAVRPGAGRHGAAAPATDPVAAPAPEPGAAADPVAAPAADPVAAPAPDPVAAAEPVAARAADPVAAHAAVPPSPPAPDAEPVAFPRAASPPPAARPVAPGRRDIAPLEPTSEAEDPALERTVPRGAPLAARLEVEAGAPIDARLDPEWLSGVTVREVLGLDAGPDGAPMLQIVFQGRGGRRRHPVRLVAERRAAAAGPPPAAPTGTSPAVAAVFAGALGLLVGLGLGFWLAG